MNKLTVSSYEIESAEETSQAALSQAVVLRKKFLHSLVHNLLHLLDMPHNVVLNHVSHGLISSDATHRVSLIGGSPANRVCSEKVLDVLSETNGRERKVRSGESLSTSEDVGDDALIGLEGEELTASANASHYLIDNQKNVIFVAESSDSLNNLGRINEHTCGTSDSFHHNGSNSRWVFVNNGLLKIGKVIRD